MPPVILAVRGPAQVLPNHVADFEAELGDGWSAPQRAQISWRLELEGKVVGIREDVGPLLQVAVPAVAAGRRGRVVPFHAMLGDGPAWEGAVEATDAGATATPSAAVTVATRKDFKKWWARVDGDPEFVVGQEFQNGSRLGLFNSADPIGPFYNGMEWAPDLGLWAPLLGITAAAEGGGNMAALNTWDRARFTFGFIQFAAHTPDDNFVLLLRRLLALPLAAHYLPDLSLAGGRVKHKTLGLLETATSTDALQKYFNPDAAKIDAGGEVDLAARLMHWTRADVDARRAQVALAAEKLRRYLVRKAADVDGHADTTCLLVWDISHQGRAQSYANQVRPALAAADPEAALLEIGADAFPGRIATLRKGIKRLRDAGVAGRHRYDAAVGDLVGV